MALTIPSTQPSNCRWLTIEARKLFRGGVMVLLTLLQARKDNRVVLHPSDNLGDDWTETFVESRAPRDSSSRGFPKGLNLRAVYLQNQDADCFRVALADARPEARHLDESDFQNIVAEGWQSRAGQKSHAEILVVGPPSDPGNRLDVFGPKSDSPLRSPKREHIKALTELALSQRSRSER